jgi:hypothetical protein
MLVIESRKPDFAVYCFRFVFADAFKCAAIARSGLQQARRQAKAGTHNAN